VDGAADGWLSEGVADGVIDGSCEACEGDEEGSSLEFENFIIKQNKKNKQRAFRRNGCEQECATRILRNLNKAIIKLYFPSFRLRG
jgi:hypothetical protein